MGFAYRMVAKKNEPILQTNLFDATNKIDDFYVKTNLTISTFQCSADAN